MTAVAVEMRSARPSALSRAWAFVRRHVLTAYSILFFAYLMLPIAVVIVFSFNRPKGRFNYKWEHFTIGNWTHWNAIPGIQSAVQLFGQEFGEHAGRGCSRPRDIPVPKLVDFDEKTGSLAYDERYRLKQPDWTYADESP